MADKPPAQARYLAPAEFTELRVHGVGGTPPENLLDHSEPVQVAGDNIAGFYRRPDRDDLEAYSWGGTTAKAATRALWLLLLPFALANVAGWMITTRPGRQTWKATWIKGIVRVFALAITGLYVMWIGLLSVDLVGYQCGGQEACFDSRWWLKFFGNNFFVADPARRLAVGLVVPLALVALFVFLVKRSQDRYERVFDDEVEKVVGPNAMAESDGDPALDAGLSSGPFWHSPGLVGRLARIHLAAGLTGVATIVAYAVWQLDRERDSSIGSLDNAQFWLFAAGLALGALLVASVLGIKWVSRLWSWAYFYVSLALFAAVGLEALVHDRTDVTSEPLRVAPQLLPGYSTFALPATLLLALLIVAMLALQLFDRDRRDLAKSGKKHEVTQMGKMQPLGFFGGFGPFFVSVAATLTTGLLLAGGVVRVADWLGDRECPAGDTCPPGDAGIIEYSHGYEWFALILLAVLILVLADVARRIWKLKSDKPANKKWGPGWANRGRLDSIDNEYMATPDSRSPGCQNSTIEEPCGAGTGEAAEKERDAFLLSVSKTRRIRSALGAGDRAAGYILGGILLVTLAIFFLRLIFADDPLGTPPRVWEWLQFVVAPATWLAAAVPLGAIWAIRRSIRSEGTRRKIGIVWDVITFWPRWYHPLAPPSYAARAIPQLGLRLKHLTTGGNTVVLSSHSQGTIIAAATMLRVNRDIRQQVALLTHGSPLRHLYGKFFPAYFGTQDMYQLRTQLARGGEPAWHNLYRLTDPIGGAVFGEEAREEWVKDREHGTPTDPDIDELVPDPLTDSHLPADPCPEPEGHSNYFSNPQPCRCPPYEAAVATLRSHIPLRLAESEPAP